MKRLLFIFLHMTLLLGLSKCNYSNLKAQKGSSTSLSDKTTNPISLDYVNIAKFVLSPSCVKCHGEKVAKGDVNLESYENIIANIEEVKLQVETDEMPPRQKLTVEQKQLLLGWIALGAPEKQNSAQKETD